MPRLGQRVGRGAIYSYEARFLVGLLCVLFCLSCGDESLLGKVYLEKFIIEDVGVAEKDCIFR